MRRGLFATAVLVGAVGVAGVLLFGREGSERPVASVEVVAAPQATSALAPAPTEPPPQLGTAQAPLPSGRGVELSAAALAEGEPYSLYLDLGEAPSSADFLAMRVVDPNGGVIEGRVRVEGAARTTARLELPAAELSLPGRYLVEVKTQERTHFPLRRYVIELR